jgi:hypothetical protein
MNGASRNHVAENITAPSGSANHTASKFSVCTRDVRREKQRALTSTLLEHGLADEVLLLVYPVLLGKGKRFFAEGTPPRAFELASTKSLSSGIVINAYKAAGPLKNQP